jgi:hypothetical protein
VIPDILVIKIVVLDIYTTPPIVRERTIRGMTVTGKTKIFGGKTYPIFTLSTINLTWADLGSNTSLHVKESGN